MRDNGEPEPTLKYRLADLPERHRQTLNRAVAHVLSTSIAETTLGQIVDGLPLSSVALDRYSGAICPDHPLIDTHLALSPEVMEQVRHLRFTFDPRTLTVNPNVRTYLFIPVMQCIDTDIQAPSPRTKLASEYIASAPGSRAFQTALVELVVRVVHHISALLYQQGPVRKSDDPLYAWRPGPEQEDQSNSFFISDTSFPVTLFRHDWYVAYEDYTEKVADGVGYWAESRIFGGVVLFDRREPGSAPDVDVSCTSKETNGPSSSKLSVLAQSLILRSPMPYICILIAKISLIGSAALMMTRDSSFSSSYYRKLHHLQSVQYRFCWIRKTRTVWILKSQ